MKPKLPTPEVADSEPVLGYAHEGDEGEQWGAFGGWNDESYEVGIDGEDGEEADGADGRDVGEVVESEGEVGQEEDVAAASFPALEVAGISARSKLVIGSIVSALHSDPQWRGYYYAELVAVPSADAKGAGSKSVTLRWLDEAGREGSGIYEYDPLSPKPEKVAFKNIVNATAPLTACIGPGGQQQWLEPAALAARDAHCASGPELPKAKQPTASDDAVQHASSTGTNASGASRAKAIDVDAIELRSMGRGRRVNDANILSSDPEEYLTDAHYHNALAMIPRPNAINLFSPCSAPIALKMFQKKSVRAAVSADEPRFSAFVQNFVLDMHWRKLIIFVQEKRVYYHEPYGGRVGVRNEICIAFERALGRLNAGWSFESITIKVQTDGHNCGVWGLVIDEARS